MPAPDRHDRHEKLVSHSDHLSDLINQAEKTARPQADAQSRPKARTASTGRASAASAVDLDALIGAGVAHLNRKNPPAYKNDAASGSSRNVGAGETAMDTESSAGVGLDGLVQQAAHSVGAGRGKAARPDASAKSTSTAPNAASDISLIVARASGMPAPIVETTMAAPDEHENTRQAARSTTIQNMAPWAAALLISLLIGGGGWYAYQHRAVDAPLLQGSPTFPLTAKQKELVEYLRAAHTEVERYREAHGRLPSRIEMKVRGVVFYIRPVKDSYMLMAVSEHQNLVLMGDGRWHKAQ